MRISSNLFFQTGLNSINAQQADLVHLYKQVGSGKRMVTPSDDPLAAAQAINVSQTLAMGERYAANRQVASSNLGMQENVLNTVTLQLQEIKTRLVEVGNGTMSDIDRAALAEVLQGSRDALLNLANSTDGNGQYLFSGSKGNSEPFSESGLYLGDSSQRLIQADQTRRIASADLGIDIFSRAAPGSTGFVTIPQDSNKGSGQFGKTTITDVSGGTAINKKVEIEFTVDGSGERYYTVKIDGVIDAPAVPDPLAPSPEHRRYDPTAGKLLGEGFGVEIDFSGLPEDNDKFTLVPLNSSYSVTKDSTMSIANVTQLATGGPAFTITYDESAMPAYTVQTVETSPATWAATPNGDGQLEIRDDAVPPNLVAVVSLYGEPTTGSSATIEPGGGSVSRNELNIFATLDELIANLKSPTAGTEASAQFQNTLNSALQRVDATYNNVLSVRASAGTRMNELGALDANGANRVLDYKNQLSKLEDLDYYTAITQLQLRTTALEAAAMAFQKIQNTSLFNMNGR